MVANRHLYHLCRRPEIAEMNFHSLMFESCTNAPLH